LDSLLMALVIPVPVGLFGFVAVDEVVYYTACEQQNSKQDR
jgi:hypothetical protein